MDSCETGREFTSVPSGKNLSIYRLFDYLQYCSPLRPSLPPSLSPSLPPSLPPHTPTSVSSAISTSADERSVAAFWLCKPCDENVAWCVCARWR